MSAKRPSEKQAAASRNNGAKSKGPATPEGRARSSQNALRDGLSSAVVVLPHEDRSLFEHLRDSYMESFDPADQPEHDLIETMAASRWRLNRLQEVEAKIFEKEMLLRAPELAEQIDELSPVEVLACVFDRMADKTKSLPMLVRYEGSLNRSYERAFKQLQQLQNRDRKGAEVQQNAPPSPAIVRLPPPQQNEPEIEPQPSAPAAIQPQPSPSDPTAAPKTTPGEPLRT